MIDIQFIRDNSELVAEKSKQKGYPVDVTTLLEKDDQRRSLLSKVETLRRQRNDLSDSSKGQKPSPEQIQVGKSLKEKISMLEIELETTEADFQKILKLVPNMPSDDVPIGSSEDENQEVYRRGDVPQFDFVPINHADLAATRGWLDKERATKVSGTRFAYIKGDMVRLQMALVYWIMDVVTNEKILRDIADYAGLTNVSSKPFTPILPPLMLKTEMYDAMDRLEPRDDRYKIEGEELWLQGSAEHVLGSMHADEIFEEADMPIRTLGYATSFRKEAGTYGKDMEGIIRMHQFDKLEMESFTSPDAGHDEHLFMIAIQEYILSQLKLPYRKLLKCTFDIGKPNSRGVDLEVWLPSQQKYRETHTADYMTDYQARRLQTRYRRNVVFSKTEDVSEPNKPVSKIDLIHTNDATALALGRGMVAILENYQTKDGGVRVPEVLKPYLGGKEQL